MHRSDRERQQQQWRGERPVDVTGEVEDAPRPIRRSEREIEAALTGRHG